MSLHAVLHMAGVEQWPSRRDAAFHGLVAAGLLLFLFIFAHRTLGFDAYAYWSVDLTDPYAGSLGGEGFFAYSPPIAVLAAPLSLLPWDFFLVGWMALLLAAIVFMGRRATLVLLAFPPVAIELFNGNIHLLLAAAVVAGFRYPAAWSFLLLTKVTPAIGLLWFVARREWRQLAVALLVTAGIALVSMLVLPTQWLDWIALLVQSGPRQLDWPAIPVPLWLRLLLAAGLVWWGARRDAYWTVPAAATFALPVLWLAGLSMLVGCWALSGDRRRYYVPDARAPGQ